MSQATLDDVVIGGHRDQNYQLQNGDETTYYVTVTDEAGNKRGIIVTDKDRDGTIDSLVYTDGPGRNYVSQDDRDQALQLIGQFQNNVSGELNRAARRFAEAPTRALSGDSTFRQANAGGVFQYDDRADGKSDFLQFMTSNGSTEVSIVSAKEYLEPFDRAVNNDREQLGFYGLCDQLVQSGISLLGFKASDF